MRSVESGTRSVRVDVLLCDPVGRSVEIEEHLAVVATLNAPVLVFTWSTSPSSVSVNSVKTFVRQIYRKISDTRRAQAVAWGLANGC